MENLDALLHGFTIALSWQHLALMVGGVLLGILVGVLPGLGAPNGVTLLLPLTFGMEPIGGIIVLSHVLGRALRRLDDIDPVQHPGRALVGGDDVRRVSAGEAGARRARRWRPRSCSAAFGALAGVVVVTLLANSDRAASPCGSRRPSISRSTCWHSAASSAWAARIR